MNFEKVDLFCPKCGKYSVFKDPSQYNCETWAEKHACESCYHSWYMEEINLEEDVFEPKQPVESGFDIFPKELVSKWAENRLKQIMDFKFLKGSQWEKMEGTYQVKVNEPFKCPTYDGDMKDLEVKIGDGKTIGQNKITCTVK
jgi:hypothetical protein